MDTVFNSLKGNTRNAVIALKEFNDVSRKKSVIDNQAAVAKLDLFEDDSKACRLMIVLKKVPSSSCKLATISFRLPFGFLNKTNTSSCLFVKDLDKDKWNPDIDKDARSFKDHLLNKGVVGIEQVVSLRQLKREFKTYEAKRKLSSAYDVFLCDKRVVRQISRNLGKAFHERKKLPFPVDICKGDTQAKIDRALSTAVFVLKNTSTRCTAVVGSLDQSAADIADNVVAALRIAEAKFPGGFSNVRSVYLSTASSPQIPVYASLASANSVTLPVSQSSVASPVVDELTTLEDEDEHSCVKVFADGRVQMLDATGAQIKSKRDELQVAGLAKRRRKRQRPGAKKPKVEAGHSLAIKTE